MLIYSLTDPISEPDFSSFPPHLGFKSRPTATLAQFLTLVVKFSLQFFSSCGTFFLPSNSAPPLLHHCSNKPTLTTLHPPHASHDPMHPPIKISFYAPPPSLHSSSRQCFVALRCRGTHT